jgi:hypothetical protein
VATAGKRPASGPTGTLDNVVAPSYGSDGPDFALLREDRAPRAVACDGDGPLRQPGIPVVTAIDGHPHALSFLGSVAQAPITCLGGARLRSVSEQVRELYEQYDLDPETIVSSALELIA